MKKAIIGFIGIIIIYVAAASYLMIAAAQEKPQRNAEYVLILGARVYEDRLSLTLKARMDKGIEYLRENPETKVIVSGGKGANEVIKEATAMKQYLLEKGIKEERIFVEDQSTSTYENIQYSMEKFHISKAVLISNDFHIYRAKFIAKRLGLETEGLAAPTPWKAKAKSYAREYFAIIKTWMMDQ